MARSSGSYTESGDLGPFDYFIEVNGIKIVSLGSAGGQPSVEKQFTLKIARIVQELLSNKPGNIISNKQDELIAYMSANEVIQRVGMSSYDSYTPDLENEPGWDNLMDSTLNTDFIWQLDGDSGNTQSTEVIEHMLHTITRFGLPGVYGKEFDYDSPNSLISRAFEEAKENGVYSTEEYSGGDQGDPDFKIMLKQEYMYCLIYANWGMISTHVDGGSLSPEWSDSHLTSKSIRLDNPLGQKVFDEYISTVISAPNIEIVDLQFKDLGGGVELYIPDGFDLVGGKYSDNLKGNNGNNVISGSSGDDTLIGVRGKDSLSGGLGDDLVRAGNGRDVIDGGDGSDTMYGGFGLNTFEDADDGEIDQLFLKSDQHSYNWIYDKAGNSPNGQKADKIMELDPFDEIFVQGVQTEELDFQNVVHYSNLGETLEGIGIYASGALEAVYVGDDLSLGQIESMTQGIL